MLVATKTDALALRSVLSQDVKKQRLRPRSMCSSDLVSLFASLFRNGFDLLHDCFIDGKMPFLAPFLDSKGH